MSSSNVFPVVGMAFTARKCDVKALKPAQMRSNCFTSALGTRSNLSGPFFRTVSPQTSCTIAHRLSLVRAVTFTASLVTSKYASQRGTQSASVRPRADSILLGSAYVIASREAAGGQGEAGAAAEIQGRAGRSGRQRDGFPARRTPDGSGARPSSAAATAAMARASKSSARWCSASASGSAPTATPACHPDLRTGRPVRVRGYQARPTEAPAVKPPRVGLGRCPTPPRREPTSNQEGGPPDRGARSTGGPSRRPLASASCPVAGQEVGLTTGAVGCACGSFRGRP